MNIDSILEPERTVCSVEAKSKKRAIEFAATQIAAELPDLDVGEVYRGLLARERLGTTALGEGVAIPHCRLKTCDRIIGGLYVLDEGVDFAAPDDELVHIMFVLLVPESENTEHLATLSLLAKTLSNPDYRRALRHSKSNEALYSAALSADMPADKTQQAQ